MMISTRLDAQDVGTPRRWLGMPGAPCSPPVTLDRWLEAAFTCFLPVAFFFAVPGIVRAFCLPALAPRGAARNGRCNG